MKTVEELQIKEKRLWDERMESFGNVDKVSKILLEYEKTRARRFQLEEVLELIDETKLPEDKDYRYSNEYIDSWIEELKQKITGDYKQESEGGTKT